MINQFEKSTKIFNKDPKDIIGKNVKITQGEHKGKIAKVVKIDFDTSVNKNRLLIEKTGVGGAVENTKPLSPNNKGELCCPYCTKVLAIYHKNKRFYYDHVVEEIVEGES